MSVEWGPHLAVGVAEVDEQHKELFRQINLFAAAISDGKGADQIGVALDFLKEYTVTHFRDEERIMTQSAYADQERHRREHELFRQEIDKLSLRVKNDGGTKLNVLLTRGALLTWLANHIYNFDKGLAAHVRSCGAGT